MTSLVWTVFWWTSNLVAAGDLRHRNVDRLRREVAGDLAALAVARRVVAADRVAVSRGVEGDVEHAVRRRRAIGPAARRFAGEAAERRRHRVLDRMAVERLDVVERRGRAERSAAAEDDALRPIAVVELAHREAGRRREQHGVDAVIGRRDGDELGDRAEIRPRRGHAGDLDLQALQVLAGADRALAVGDDGDLHRGGVVGVARIERGVVPAQDVAHRFGDLGGVLGDRAVLVNEADVVGLDAEPGIVRQIERRLDRRQPAERVLPVLPVVEVGVVVGRIVAVHEQHGTALRRRRRAGAEQQVVGEMHLDRLGSAGQ